MILLDTNAVIWIGCGHRRAKALMPGHSRLYVSPATVLELQFLHESGRIRLRTESVQWVVHDDRWVVDEPPPAAWFLRAVEVAWTRDPFDRLLVAHAQLRRWRVATGDATILEHLGPTNCLEL